ncbi:hypothetical protein HDK90DRAFT_9241 [Phyllosticta capitalensis]|uniref:Protein efr3 n=1 Tax=Phyllosticta capitalensis TaxID=121624 RepID=A0ABR1Z2G0_9PEZI
MNHIRQSCRPKHQVLILKCYPQLQKGYREAEVKPNSSELSYLLYYASTRRTKLVKVGEFLDKRTAGDVWRRRIGNVLVTLQILKALIEKCPRDIPLYALSLFSILRTVLNSNDITLVEASVPTFETLCAHLDAAALAADNELASLYEEIVQLYAFFANKEKEKEAGQLWTMEIRFRKAGLSAIKAAAGSECLSADAGKQLGVIVPVILVNLYSTEGIALTQLELREKEREDMDKEAAFNRRKSTSTMRTVEEGDPGAVARTTEDSDKLAEEEAGILALQALRNIFEAVSRDQLRQATAAVLKFISTRVKWNEHFPNGDADGSWATTLFAMMSGWAPVQDRFVILVTASHTLVHTKILEENLDQEYVLATIITWLLGDARINFIGLSVMDVLIGLVNHILKLLHVKSPSLMNGDAGAKASKETLEASSNSATQTPSASAADVVDRTAAPSEARVRLLKQLKNCIANLAKHIYYNDQIPDMLQAILIRLKPSTGPSQSIAATTAAAIEESTAVVDLAATTGSLERAPAGSFFSFETARVVALEAIKDILHVANSPGTDADGNKSSIGRSRVSVDVWEGTQWLLRDPIAKVRRCYVDALLTWLELEVRKSDLRVVDPKTERKDTGKREGDNLARRAVSNASQTRGRDKSPRRLRTSFMPLLHLAVYDNALQFAPSLDNGADAEFLLLHLLLSRLVLKLGVNALLTGLPMMMRLQEDISNSEESLAKIRLGSLVHGYLWSLAHAFDFETSATGLQITAEINRRKERGLWLEGIAIPPVELQDIDNKATTAPGSDSQEAIELTVFENRQELIDRISDGYSDAMYSPPGSPPASPGRSSIPNLNVNVPSFTGLGIDSNLQSSPPRAEVKEALTPAKSNMLPVKIRDQMLESWNKEAVLAIMAAHYDASSASGSLSHRTKRAHSAVGAAAGGASTPNGFLGVGGGYGSPTGLPHLSPSPSIAGNHRAALGALNDYQQRNASGSPTTSSARSAVRLDDLKKVLTNQGDGPLPLTRHGRDSGTAEAGEEAVDDDDESFVSADFSASEYSYAAPGSSYSHANADDPNARPPLSTVPSSTLDANTPTEDPSTNGHTDHVPPVPPLPAGVEPAALSKNPSPPGTTTANGGNANTNGTLRARSIKSRGAQSARSGRGRSRSRSAAASAAGGGQRRTSGASGILGGGAGGKVDLGGLLAGIDVDGDSGDDTVGLKRGRAPY